MNSVEILIKVMAAAAQPFICSCNIRLCILSGSKVTSYSKSNKRQAAHKTLPSYLRERACKCSGKNQTTC